MDYPIKLDKRAIEGILPHRGPALMLDEGEILGPLSSRGSFIFTEESYQMFEWHFPGHPVVRGVDLIETCGLTASLVIRAIPECQGLTGMFREVSKAIFKKEVQPGDTLEMSARITSYRDMSGKRGRLVIGEFEAEGSVGDEVAVKVQGKFFAIPLNPQ